MADLYHNRIHENLNRGILVAPSDKAGPRLIHPLTILREARGLDVVSAHVDVRSAQLEHVDGLKGIAEAKRARVGEDIGKAGPCRSSTAFKLSQRPDYGIERADPETDGDRLTGQALETD